MLSFNLRFSCLRFRNFLQDILGFVTPTIGIVMSFIFVIDLDSTFLSVTTKLLQLILKKLNVFFRRLNRKLTKKKEK